MLAKLRKYISVAQYKQLMAGIFTSKLVYCIGVWSVIWEIPGLLESDGSRTSLAKQDMKKLQILQNKALRLMHGSDRSEPTVSLLKRTNSLSVHQLASYLILVQVFKIKTAKEPSYHFDRLFDRDSIDNNTDARLSRNMRRVDFDLSLARGSFFYQGNRLWQALPEWIRNENNEAAFRGNCRQWVLDNMKIKP